MTIQTSNQSPTFPEMARTEIIRKRDLVLKHRHLNILIFMPGQDGKVERNAVT